MSDESGNPLNPDTIRQCEKSYEQGFADGQKSVLDKFPSTQQSEETLAYWGEDYHEWEKENFFNISYGWRTCHSYISRKLKGEESTQ
jgi:hypothetical protein